MSGRFVCLRGFGTSDVGFKATGFRVLDGATKHSVSMPSQRKPHHVFGYVVNTPVHAVALVFIVDQPEQLRNKMCTAGTTPNVVTYGAVLSANAAVEEAAQLR